MDLDGRVPDAQERLVLDVLAFPQPVQPGPAVGIDEGLKNLGIVGPVGVHARQRGLAQHDRRGLDFPEQLFGLGVAEVVEVLDIDDVQVGPVRSAVVGLDRTHRRQPVAYPHRLTDFGNLCGTAGCHVTKLRPSSVAEEVPVGSWQALSLLRSRRPLSN